MTFIRTKAAIAALSLAGALAFAGTAAAARQDDGGDRHGGRVTSVHCGQTLTQSVRLANDLTDCPADGLVIGADGITVDLNGHTIDGTVAPPADCDNASHEPAGIKNGGGDNRVYDRLTIENGALQQFAQGFSAGSGTDGMADSRLRDLTVRDNSSGGLEMGSAGLFTNRNRVKHNLITGTRCGFGIVVNSSDSSLVAENTIRDNRGGILLCCSVGNVIRDNLVAHNAEDGIAVCCDGRENVIEHNKVFDNASLGILVFFGTEGTLVRENHVARNGDNIILNASANTVAHNLVTDALGCPSCDPPTGFGILVDTADDNVVAGNVVTRTKEDGIRIFDFDPTDPDIPNRTVVRGNVVHDAGVDGVHVDARSTDTVLERNSAFGAGDDGIEVDSASALLTRNLAWFNHDLGIDAPGVTDGGGNSARGNGNRKAQCIGVACK